MAKFSTRRKAAVCLVIYAADEKSEGEFLIFYSPNFCQRVLILSSLPLSILIVLNNMDKKAGICLSRCSCMAVISLCAFLGGGASAQTAEKYLSYTTDINGDGQLDILVKPMPKIIMLSLDDDLDVPIALPLAIPSFLLLSNGNGGYQLSTDVGQAMGNPAWTQGLVNVTVNSGQSSNGASITINYVTSSQLPSIVSKATDGAIVLTQSGTAPLANNVPYVEHMCRMP